MKHWKAYISIILLSLLMAACGKHNQGSVLLQGKINGLGNDTIYLHGVDQFYHHTDTITLKEGRFKVWLDADTLSDTRLCFADGTEYPLYFRPGDKLTIVGDTTHLNRLKVTGNEENELLNAFFTACDTLSSAHEVGQQAEQYIRNHPDNLAILYLLDHYVVQSSHPNLQCIDSLIMQLNSALKDRPYIDRLNTQIQEMKKSQIGRVTPYFSLPGLNKKQISRNDYRDKYLLIHFWASWDDPSRKVNKQWRKLYEQQKQQEKQKKDKKEKKEKKQLALLGISLDGNHTDWEHAVKEDSLKWDQGCELDGWSSKTVGSYHVHALPDNVFINPKGTIIGRNVTPEVVADTLGFNK